MTIAQEVGMITTFIAQVFLLKFALNDLPHVMGLGTTLPQGAAPKPRFFTHQVEVGLGRSVEDVLSSGFIKPLSDNVASVSLDGCWGITPGVTFMFDISKLGFLKRRPVIYVGTEVPLDTEEFSNFTAYSVDCILAAEVEILEPIPVSWGKLVDTVPTKTELNRYVDKVLVSLTPQMEETIAYDKPTTIIPTDEQKRLLHGYNKMACELCGVDYNAALKEVEGSLARLEWKKWW